LDFIELKVTVSPDFSDIIMAELAEVGYESFVESPQGLDAYVQKSLFDTSLIEEIAQKYAVITPIEYSFTELERKNWNEEWEKNYQPIYIGDQCVVRASFHEPARHFPYEVIINPKMSFGTGHHETTSLMLENQLHLDHQGKKVMDVGCGTGILAIMASKRGATEIDAFDTDDWAVENTKENCLLNNSTTIRVQQGTIADVQLDATYDIVLANINRNVLLKEIPVYASFLPSGGLLAVSGFYESDARDIEKVANSSHLQLLTTKTRQNWASLVFTKQI
jgi:ribosomal protein L11 methyltransferase